METEENLYTVPVEVVDGVAPVVFNMPTETREAHSNVQPGHLIQETGRSILHRRG